MKRGDVVLAWYPFASGVGGKRRPCVVIQNDDDNLKLSNVIIALITSNLARNGDKSHFLIEVATPEGQQTGLLLDSLQPRDHRSHTDRSSGRLFGTCFRRRVE